MIMSWEYKQSRRVMAAVIHTEATSVAWALGIRNLLPHDMPIIPYAGMPYDHSRNTAVQNFLSSDYEHLFFIDSDVVVPSAGVLRLLEHRKPIVSAMYCRRSPPHALPVMIRHDVGWVTNFTPGTTIDVDLVGAGALLVHRRVFEDVPPQRPGKPWFDWRVDLKGHMPDGACLSEDFTWCSHVKNYGFQIWVDTSIVCKHIGAAQAGPGTFLPCETTHIT